FASHNDCLSKFDRLRLPAIVRECAVGVRHLVRIFALLDGRTTAVRGIHELAGKAIDHGRLVALAGSSNQPADRESLATLGPNIDRHLIGRTTNAARTDFNVRGDVVEGLVEDSQGLLLGLALHGVKGAVYDAFSHGLLAVKHDRIHELGDDEIAELRVRIDLTLFCTMATGHIFRLSNVDDALSRGEPRAAPGYA